MFINERPQLITPPPPKPKAAPGLGSLLAWMFGKAGIRKRAGCGCQRRQEWLDRKVPLKWLKLKWTRRN